MEGRAIMEIFYWGGRQHKGELSRISISANVTEGQ